MDLTSPREVREIMERFGVTTKKEYGQNFLINDAIPRRIAEAACGSDGGACVIEIGPGIGVMTRELSTLAESVLAVEVDASLMPVLDYTLSDCGNVTVLNRDILDCDIDELAMSAFGGREFCVCANLPYYITTPIIMRLLEHGGKRLRSITVMVQTEVAARLVAKPGSVDYGAITASVSYHGCASRLFTVSPGSFLPAPKVTSTVVKIELYRDDERPVSVCDYDTLRRVIAGAFGQRRKTLENALSAAFPELGKERVGAILQSVGIDSLTRGERLSVAEFASIADAIVKNS